MAHNSSSQQIQMEQQTQLEQELEHDSKNKNHDAIAPNNQLPTAPPPLNFTPLPLEESSDHPGFEFWRTVLRRARLVVAPMVDASELPWRMLCRRYGAELCYTPMLHSAVLVRDGRYRRDSLLSCEGDRPLIVQLCGNDPAIVSEACRLVAPHCDAIDLNLGCPQAIAKRGRYGAYLMDNLSLIEQLVISAVASSSVPVTCKMRIFPTMERTVAYARMLQDAGASLITVHARTREQKGPSTGLADWAYIKAVRDAVDVPVYANGNIQCRADVERCLQATGAQGVMSAETNLHNPAFFVGPQYFPGTAPFVWDMALEYLELVLTYPCPISYTRGHIFKLMHPCLILPMNSGVRLIIGRTNSIDEMKGAVLAMRDNMTPYVKGKVWEDGPPLPLPPWLCQPYVRVALEEHRRRGLEGEQRQLSVKRTVKEADLLQEQVQHLSKKKAKKLLRNPRKKFPGVDADIIKLCVCRSLRGGKCEHQRCKACCKSHCYNDNLDCIGHKIWVKTNRRKAKSESPSSPANSVQDGILKNVDVADIFSDSIKLQKEIKSDLVQNESILAMSPMLLESNDSLICGNETS